MILSYKYRLLPSKQQHRRLAEVLEMQRQLYNAALEERISCYRKTGRSQTYFSQSISLTVIRKDDVQGYGAIPTSICRGTLQRLHKAYAAFFSRVKSGQTPGFPRFKSKDRWRSFSFSQWEGIKFDGRRVRIKGFASGIKVHVHRAMPEGEIISCQIRKDTKGWSICFQINMSAAERKAVASAVGIDVGLKAFAFQSDGISIPAPQIARKRAKTVRRLNRALSRCKRGSKRRVKVRAHLAAEQTKISSTRNTWLHQISARITRNYDLIAVEDLKVANMLKNEHLARSISDAGWATFTDMLSYKAERAGGTFVRVDPKMTSQICSGCGVIVRKGLADRVHNCPECGLVLDRDHNAALNILHRAVLRPGTDNVVHTWGKRRAGNLKVVKS